MRPKENPALALPRPFGDKDPARQALAEPLARPFPAEKGPDATGSRLCRLWASDLRAPAPPPGHLCRVKEPADPSVPRPRRGGGGRVGRWEGRAPGGPDKLPLSSSPRQASVRADPRMSAAPSVPITAEIIQRAHPLPLSTHSLGTF